MELFDDPVPGSEIPTPILAIDNHETLAGGLAFTSFSRPGSDVLAVWINALLVVPDYRRMGVATRLVGEAEVEAIRVGCAELFVRTDVPDLYRRLGWRVIETNHPDVVLVKALRNDEQALGPKPGGA